MVDICFITISFSLYMAAGVATADSARRMGRGTGWPAGLSPTQAADAMGRPASSRGTRSSAAAACAAAAVPDGAPGRPSAAAAAAICGCGTTPVSGSGGPSAAVMVARRRQGESGSDSADSKRTVVPECGARHEAHSGGRKHVPRVPVECTPPTRLLTCHCLGGRGARRAAAGRHNADVVAGKAILGLGDGMAADDAHSTRASRDEDALQADARAARKQGLVLPRGLGSVAQNKDLLAEVGLHVEEPAAGRGPRRRVIAGGGRSGVPERRLSPAGSFPLERRSPRPHFWGFFIPGLSSVSSVALPASVQGVRRGLVRIPGAVAAPPPFQRRPAGLGAILTFQATYGRVVEVQARRLRQAHSAQGQKQRYKYSL